MKPRITIGEVTTPDGERLRLVEQDGEYSVLLGNELLMASTAHHSEEQMAAAILGESPRPGMRVLVGGLGMGFTLRAVLDRLRADGEVVVAELLPAVVEWNRGPLAPLAGAPLSDPRVQLDVADVLEVAATSRGQFDGIVLDVDNGPEPFTVRSNGRLYSQKGLRVLRDALRPHGTLVVWSAFASPPFEREMASSGLRVRAIRTRSRRGKGSHHVLFVGRR